MTALTDQCEIIRSWLNLGSDVYPDSVVTIWIRMAEESLSKRLRCKDMLITTSVVITDQRFLLPLDWREMYFVRVVDGWPLRYLPRDDFYNPDKVSDQPNCYTMIGNYIMVGVADDTVVELSYYQSVPPLNDVNTWLQTNYITLFTVETLHIASMYAIEDERTSLWEGQAAALVNEINTEHDLSKASGSRLTQRTRRGFG